MSESILERKFKRNEFVAQKIGAPDAFVRELNSFDRILKRRVRGKLNGESTSLEAVRVWHCNPFPTGAVPFRGGTRLHPTATEENFKVFAMDMTDKGVLAKLSMGGAKGGLPIDQTLCIGDELRRWTEELAVRYHKERILDVGVDCLGPDVGVTSEMMGWMLTKLAEVSDSHTSDVLATMTGKPLHLGGQPGRDNATSHGMLIQLKYFIENLLQDTNIKFSGDTLSLAVQGKGNVGWHLALLTQDPRFNFLNLCAISGSDMGLYNPNGLNVPKLGNWIRDNDGSLKGYPDADEISNEELLELDVDILSPSAIENQITDANADKIRAMVLTEGGNEAIWTIAHDILAEMGVIVFPAPVASVGGVVVSTFEHRRNLADRLHEVDYPKEKAWVTAELTSIMHGVTKAVWKKKEQCGEHLALAADMLVKERLMKLLERKHANNNKNAVYD